MLATCDFPKKSASITQSSVDFLKSLNRIDKIGAQSKSDSKRFIKLGAKPDKITVTGSLKYHLDIRGIDESGPFIQRTSGIPRK